MSYHYEWVPMCTDCNVVMTENKDRSLSCPSCGRTIGESELYAYCDCPSCHGGSVWAMLAYYKTHCYNCHYRGSMSSAVFKDYMDAHKLRLVKRRVQEASDEY